jgi:hypothetical protein
MIRKTTLISVGINKYDEYPTLGLCVKDSRAISEALSKRICDLDSTVINDEREPVSVKLIKSQIEKVKDRDHTQDDLVIFYYAGHGFSLNGRDYITVKDTSPTDLKTAINTEDLVNDLISSGAGTIVLIVDTCRTNMSRGLNVFGERTAELSRRKGIITFFSCSPGETANELPLLDNGVFTYSFVKLLGESVCFTPYEFNSRLVIHVRQLCQEHKLGVQTPYTAVAPLEKANLDIVTGETHFHTSNNKDMILIVGPSNAGKTAIGNYISNTYGYVHAEMSSFAWKRYNANADYTGTIQEFMESEVWKNGNEDIIAKDLISAYEGINKIVVCGARRPEEIETIISQGWNINQIFVFANSTIRYKRLQNQADRYGPSYKEFVKKDLKEFGWGMALMPSMKNMEIVINEKSFDLYYKRVREILQFDP